VVYSIGIPPQETGEIRMTGAPIPAKSGINARRFLLPEFDDGAANPAGADFALLACTPIL